MDCTDQACVSGACSGNCDPEEERCNNNTPQLCSDTGAWGDKSAQCSSPSMLCKVVGDSASCASNPPYYLGAETALSTNATLAKGFLFAVPVKFAAKARALELGIVGRSDTGAFVTMALYKDNAGAPGMLLGTTTEKAVTAGQLAMSPVSALIQPAGDYWLVASFSANATSYESAKAGAKYRYVSGTYATFPATFPAGSTLVSDVQENFFVKLQDQP
jgi:hypothetical protein